MDVEQIEANIAPTEHAQQGESLPNTSQPLSQNQQAESYFTKSGKEKFGLMQNVTRAVFCYRILYVILCLVPLYDCPFGCNNATVDILLLVCVTLEIIKIAETVYQMSKIKYYLGLFGRQENLLPFNANDFQTLFNLRYALDTLHKQAFIFRVIMNVVWFLYYVIYTTLFFIAISDPGIRQKLVLVSMAVICIMLLIFSMDTIFFIFPTLLQTSCYLVFKLCQFIKKYSSKNSKLLRQLQSQQYDGCQKLTDDNICIICWDEFRENDHYIRLKCNKNHIFHSPCIRIWVQSNLTCPVCRTQLA